MIVDDADGSCTRDRAKIWPMFGSEDVTTGQSFLGLAKMWTSPSKSFLSPSTLFVSRLYYGGYDPRIGVREILMLMVKQQSAMPPDPTDNRKLFWNPKCLGCPISFLQPMDELFPT